MDYLMMTLRKPFTRAEWGKSQETSISNFLEPGLEIQWNSDPIFMPIYQGANMQYYVGHCHRCQWNTGSAWKFNHVLVTRIWIKTHWTLIRVIKCIKKPKRFKIKYQLFINSNFVHIIMFSLIVHMLVREIGNLSSCS